jgi:hypothetical protein
VSKNNEAIAKWVTGRFGEPAKIVDMIGNKKLRLLTRHKLFSE